MEELLQGMIIDTVKKKKNDSITNEGIVTGYDHRYSSEKYNDSTALSTKFRKRPCTNDRIGFLIDVIRRLRTIDY
jgi:hypothetical protein